MSKKRILLFFAAAGLILAVILGVYFYRSNLGVSRETVASLLTDYTEKIAAGNLDAARALMTEETRPLLRDPGTTLGETVYRNLKFKSVDSIYTEGSGNYAADVIMTLPDTLKITTKAGLLFGEKVEAEGPFDDPDRAIAEIYEEILSRDDLPMIDSYCVIRLETRNGSLFICGDENLQKTLEGNLN